MAYRDCFSPPISQIYEAANLLHEAATRHARGEAATAGQLIRRADMPEIGVWLDPIWLGNKDLGNPQKIDGLPPVLPKEKRHSPRMPGAEMKRALIRRDGHLCRFCTMPVVRAEVRKEICRLYPHVARWTSTKETNQHRGLQVMWLQYDHLLVHSRGGRTEMENLVVACAACNFGRDRYTLEEVGFRDPRLHARSPVWDGASEWDGLESFLPVEKRVLKA